MAEENEFDQEDPQEEKAPDELPSSKPELIEAAGPVDSAVQPPEPPPGLEFSDLTAEPDQMEDAYAEIEQEKEPTKFQIFLRKALIWLGVGAVMFFAGFLTFYFTLYQPKADALEETEAQLAQAEEDLQSLQTDMDNANRRIENLQSADEHRALLEVVVDIYAARLALTQEDTVAAKSTLSNTDEILDDVLDDISAFDAALAKTLPQRLNLIVTNIDRDPEKAIADCDLMIDDLFEVEIALYQ
ncbi:MAG: hypothetical protein PVI99_07675 [Anaerolineales bacterium]|jgi:hypothetical protein